jgi:hypothetical protein
MSAESPERRGSRTGLSRVRIGILACAYAVLGVAAGGVFDRFEWTLVIAPCIPLALLALVVGRHPIVCVIGAVLGVVAATALAVAVVGGGVADFTGAFTSGARRMLSTEWPSPRRADLVGVAAAALGVAAAASGLLITWRRWHLLPLLPLVVVYISVIGLSSPLGIRPLVLASVSLAAIVFATFRNDGSLRDRWLLLRGERRLVVLIAIDTEPLLDPIEATIALRNLEPVVSLHAIEPADPTALPPGGLPTRWRTAALSDYDGRRWTPTLTLRPIGGRLGPVTGDTVSVSVSFDVDDLSLVPLPGAPIQIDAPVGTVVRLVDRPEAGQVVNLVANVEAEAADIGSVPLAIRTPDENVAALTSLAEGLGGDGAVLDQLLEIQRTMRTDFVLDTDAEAGGLQRILIDRFLRDTKRGNTEQFATAFVLLARSLGVDARVATGFVVDQPAADGPLTLKSSDALVWPEIGLADGTWIAFDPVPEETTSATPAPPEPQVQSPAAPQPPIDPPPEPSSEQQNTTDDNTDAAADTLSTATLWALRGAAVGGMLLLPVAIAGGLILGLKYRRRRRRLRAPEPVDRIRGAWASATDDLIDAGLTIPRSATDGEIAASGETLAPDARRELHRLALLSGAATYGSPNRPDLLSKDAVACLESIDTAIVSQRTRWQRVRWRLSLRSLRSTSRSPLSA